MIEVLCEIFASCVISRFHTILLEGVCHHQEDLASVQVGENRCTWWVIQIQIQPNYL